MRTTTMLLKTSWAAAWCALFALTGGVQGPAMAQTADTVLLLAQASPVSASPVKRDAASPLQAAASASRKWSVYWGWNRSTYSNSDIHFWGADHNFTLSSVKANDMQADVTTENIFGTFLSPANMTLPQTNLRIAYQVSPDTAWALNLDHMKYVVTPDQTVAFSGRITNDPQTGANLLQSLWLFPCTQAKPAGDHSLLTPVQLLHHFTNHCTLSTVHVLVDEE